MAQKQNGRRRIAGQTGRLWLGYGWQAGVVADLQTPMSVFCPDLDDETLRCLVEALTKSGQAISIYDAEDRLRYANETYQGIFLQGFEGPFTFTEILRYGARTGIGVRIDDGDVEALIARTLPRRRSMPRKSFETDFRDGRWFWMDHTILPNGWVLTVAADITALKHNEKTLRQAHEEALAAARTDQLTGLPNRRHILDLLDAALAAGAAANSSLCVAVIDIDKFKGINDTHGHEAGDAVLQHFTRVCRERLRVQDHLGRMGGEEFLLLLPEVRLNEAVRIVERIRDGFPAVRPRSDSVAVSYTFSAGVTEALPHDNRSSILYRADRALYAAKAAGRNCTRIGFDHDGPPTPFSSWRRDPISGCGRSRSVSRAETPQGPPSALDHHSGRRRVMTDALKLVAARSGNPPGVVASAAYAGGCRVVEVPGADVGEWSRRPGHVVWIGLHEPSLNLLRQQFFNA